MSNELVKPEHLLATTNQPEHGSSSAENFAQRVLAEPGLRYQLTGLMRQVRIADVKSLGLGYWDMPSVRVSSALRHMNLDTLSGVSDRKTAAQILLHGCMEARDDLRALNNDDALPEANGLRQLPFELQLVALAKAYSGDDGAPFYPSELANGTDGAALFQRYATEKLDLTPIEVEVMRQAAMVVNGQKILDNIIMCNRYERVDLSIYPKTIVGRHAPNEGYYLPDMLEDSIRNGYYGDAWMAQYPDKCPQVVADTLKLGDLIVRLCDNTQGEARFWGAYGMSSLLLEQAFVERRESFSSEYDTVVTNYQPRNDEKAYEQYVWVRDNLNNLAADTEFSRDGMALALCSAGQRVGHMVEREITRGSTSARVGRLRMLGELYTDLMQMDPTLAEEMLARLPLIASHIHEAADPWSYRFA
jgi:hypothetical protein